MPQNIAHISLLVKDYDEAIAYYTNTLNFSLLEDTPLNEDKRWVIVAPDGSKNCSLLLAKASNEEQIETIGNQTGGRVFLFLHTDDFWKDYENMKRKGVHFLEDAREEKYGTVVVFKDLYGNKWDLVEPKT